MLRQQNLQEMKKGKNPPAKKDKEARGKLEQIKNAVASDSPEAAKVKVYLAECLAAENQLTVRGKQTDDTDRVFLHRGIAARQFQRAFMLAEGIEVTGACLDNGLLSIDLVRPVQEPRIRTIRIEAGGAANAAGNTIDITARRTQLR